jgi:hypothetical protein
MQLLIAVTDSSPHQRNLSALLPVIAGTVLLPFLVGLGIQFALTSDAFRRLLHSDEQLKRQVTSANVACSEVCDTTPSNWRHRVRQLMVVMMLLLNYCLFSGLFNDAAATAAISLESSLVVLAIEVCLHGALMLSAWMLSGLCASPALSGASPAAVAASDSPRCPSVCCTPLTPEERIAAFLSAVQKSEVLLAIPLITQVILQDAGGTPRPGKLQLASGVAAVAVVPAIVYHVIQSTTSALMAAPLKAWKVRQYCKPGTTLLPLHLSQKVGHLMQSAPTSASNPTGAEGIAAAQEEGGSLANTTAQISSGAGRGTPLRGDPFLSLKRGGNGPH